MLERNHQVGMMGSIYSSSACAFIWLGPGDEGSDRALSLIDSLNDILEHAVNGSEDDLWDFMGGKFSLLDDQPWAELKALFSRPWFHRVWTFQEPIRAPDRMIACGLRIRNWDTFLHAALACLNVKYPEWVPYIVGLFYTIQSVIDTKSEDLRLSI